MIIDTPLPGGPLRKSDLKQLEKSYITPELAERALLRRVNSVDGAAIVGRTKADFAGIVFPYVWPGERNVRDMRLRRDHPDIEIKGEARKERGKYLGAPDRGSKLYFLPGVDAAALDNIHLPITITEGEKKVIALTRLAHTVEPPAFLSCGLAGVANWRGNIGKEQGEDGARQNVRGPIPDLARVKWDGRLVYIAFDADVATNWRVRIERFRLATYLAVERGARVRFVTIPADSKHKGIDDLLGAVGPDEVWPLFQTALPAEAVHEGLELIRSAEAAADLRLLFDGAALFAQMKPGELTEIKARIRSSRPLRKIGVSIRDFERTVDEERARQARQHHQSEQPASDLRYRGQEYEITDRGLVWWRNTREGGKVPVYLSNFGAVITADVVRDDGEETTRALKLQATVRGQTREIIVSASDFGAMNWPIENLGAAANVYPTFKDHTRSAIQQLSPEIKESYLYQHIGWATIGGRQVYLHANGGIGPEGPVEVEVDLERTLSRYDLPDPAEGDELVAAVRSSLAFLDVAPDRVTMPVYSAIWRAVLGAVNVSVFVSGQTGWGKSQVAALAQQHWGPTMTATNLPANWESTANALEAMAFKCKNALLVVDDFVPKGSMQDVHRIHNIADRLLRGQGNASGRARMGADTKLRAPKTPRGLILATGEDVPKGHSLRGRMVCVEMDKTDIDWAKLTECQRAAAAGLYSAAMAGFIQWVSPRIPTMPAEVERYLEEMRAAMSGVSTHRRTPDNIANLAIGLKVYLEFATSCGALTEEEAHEIFNRAWRAFDRIVDDQNREQESDEPTANFLQMVTSAIRGRSAHLCGPDAGIPDNAGMWGYEGDVPQGTRIGWISGGDVFLWPMLAFSAAQQLARSGGGNVPVSLGTLKKRLAQRGLLASTSTHNARQTITVRRKFLGEQQEVLHLLTDTLLGLENARHPRHFRHEGSMSGFGGAECRVFSGDFEGGPTSLSALDSSANDTNVGDVGSVETYKASYGGEKKTRLFEPQNVEGSKKPDTKNPTLAEKDEVAI